jgi:small subunit ribosomal protein S16
MRCAGWREERTQAYPDVRRRSTAAQPKQIAIFKGLNNMLKIKMSRVGKRKQPTFRLLVVEHQKDPWGTYIENVGHFNPRQKETTMQLNEERIKYWISVGAKPTDTVHNLLISAGIIEDKKRNVSKLGKIAREERAKAADDAKKAKMEAAAKAKAEKEAAAAPAPEAPAEEAKA